jgi:hypothetical protein
MRFEVVLPPDAVNKWASFVLRYAREVRTTEAFWRAYLYFPCVSSVASAIHEDMLFLGFFDEAAALGRALLPRPLPDLCELGLCDVGNG